MFHVQRRSVERSGEHSMKKYILVAWMLMLCSCIACADSIPNYFNLGAASPGSVSVGQTASGSLPVCQIPSQACTPRFDFSFTTAAGNLYTSTSSFDVGELTTDIFASYGQGGTITINVNGTFFLSGYLISANATSHDVEYFNYAYQFERQIAGLFKATVLNDAYWGNTDPDTVGGSFSILALYPHSAVWPGAGHLEVTQVPEPGTLILLASGIGAISRSRFFKRA
jgi:hypothetical protein